MNHFNENNSFGLILISRLKSKRLKNKAILKISKNLSMIEYLIDKAKFYFKKSKIILATSNNIKDNKLVEIAYKKKIYVYTGNPKDVLMRIYNASLKYNLKNVLICSGDNPLIDMKKMIKLIQFHYKNKNDYSSYKNMPLGTYGWVIKIAGLKKVIKLKKTDNTEIWGNFFLENKSVKCKSLEYKTLKKFSFYKRLTVDSGRDLLLVKKLLKISNKKYPNLSDIEKIIYKNDKLNKINMNIKQKAGPLNVYQIKNFSL